MHDYLARIEMPCTTARLAAGMTSRARRPEYLIPAG